MVLCGINMHIELFQWQHLATLRAWAQYRAWDLAWDPKNRAWDAENSKFPYIGLGHLFSRAKPRAWWKYRLLLLLLLLLL